jgi:glutamyl-tRNA synthetase
MRFRVDDERTVSITDLLVGPVEQQVQQTVGDFIVCRSDGIFAYQFAVVVDDALMHINQVVRGVDLLQSTARQILLFEALEFQVPTFAHVPLLLDTHGKRFSKRIQSAGLEPIRAGGVSPAQVVGQFAAECGLVDRGEQLSAGGLAQRYRHEGYDIMRSIFIK